jgi:hypothetical protein
MAWTVGFDEWWDRDIGYGVPSICDYPGCGAEIDRGLSYVCGGEPYGGDFGCGLYFCEHHLHFSGCGAYVCERCLAGADPFTPTPDTPEWVHHKATDLSWAEWRAEQKEADHAAK